MALYLSPYCSVYLHALAQTKLAASRDQSRFSVTLKGPHTKLVSSSCTAMLAGWLRVILKPLRKLVVSVQDSGVKEDHPWLPRLSYTEICKTSTFYSKASSKFSNRKAQLTPWFSSLWIRNCYSHVPLWSKCKWSLVLQLSGPLLDPGSNFH